ncbi:hypothetical protein G6F50_013940 [Rhizopus delemar]|uniref:Uncharacterized protein n=1 Tax=Rhizopus delemar TaxID=936053 RepID=A0A9P7CB61_9FUNG|nr:hypothetical protein G6F50_013940 [Rhizopus delemar]
MRMRTRAGDLWAIPYPQELNDIPMIMGRKMDARDFADMILDQFEEMPVPAAAPAPSAGAAGRGPRPGRDLVHHARRNLPPCGQPAGRRARGGARRKVARSAAAVPGHAARRPGVSAVEHRVPRIRDRILPGQCRAGRGGLRQQES